MKTPSNIKKQLNMNKQLAPPSANIKELFGNSSNSESDVVKELFSNKNIKTRTEVNDREISIISRLYYLAEYIDNNALHTMLDTLLELKVSRKRKSREEFIKGLMNMPKNDFQIPSLR